MRRRSLSEMPMSIAGPEPAAGEAVGTTVVGDFELDGFDPDGFDAACFDVALDAPAVVDLLDLAFAMVDLAVMVFGDNTPMWTDAATGWRRHEGSDGV